MIKQFIAYYIILLCSFSYSQENCFLSWDYLMTGVNSTVALEQVNFNNFIISNGDNSVLLTELTCPINIGLFYQNEDGDFICSGYTEWDSSQNMAITAWGDDNTTSEQDGFLSGDVYYVGICIAGYVDILGYPYMSTDPPFTNLYMTNSFGSILAVDFSTDLELSQLCDPVNLLDPQLHKNLIKTLDVYGREIEINNPIGIYLRVYDDKSVDKFYGF